MIAGVDHGLRKVGDSGSKRTGAVADRVPQFGQVGKLAVEFILSCGH
ncbi:hypothetical protein MSTE_01190 [Mycobacteroides stephanolepidis]|uniref:Uncharacterized protein n=1 Tax=[Mycobacterium] stephanolepidis TaxID=1520670 RepID=A0A1Z4EU76_9MYCO|nr:hypothetical protein MSTE_01190 [[Mycobacterium] stephanolepidis]